MLNEIEKKILSVERSKVESAKFEMELKIMKAQAEVNRLEQNIIIQDSRIDEIDKTLRE